MKHADRNPMNSPAADYKTFDDTQHIARALRGDVAAFDHLVRQYTGMVYAIARANGAHQPEVAEELTQEVFLRAYLNLSRLRQHQGFPAWLVTIARNLARDWQRRQRVSSGLVQMVSLETPGVLDVPAAQLSPRETASRAEEDNRLHHAMGHLPAADRELLLLCYAEGMTHSAIARSLGLHPSSVARRMDKALARLRHTYTQDAPAALATHARPPQLSARVSALIAALAGLSATQRVALASSALTPVSTSPFARLFSSPRWAGVSLAALLLAGIGGSLFMASPGKDVPVNDTQPGQQTKRWSSRLATVLGLEQDNNPESPDRPTIIRSANQADSPDASPASRHGRARLFSGDGNNPPTETTRPVSGRPAAQPATPVLASAATWFPDKCPELAPIAVILEHYEKWIANSRLSYRREIAGPSSEPFFTASDLKTRIFTGTEITTSHGVHLEYQEQEADTGKPIFGKGVIHIRPKLNRYILLQPHGAVSTGSKVMEWYEACSPTHSLLREPGPNYNWISEFLTQLSVRANLTVTCSINDNGQKLWTLAGTDWGIELLPEVCNWPVRMYRLDQVGRPDHDRRVLEHAEFNGVTYPSRFVTTTYGSDIHQRRIPIQITTITLTLEHAGEISLPDYTPPPPQHPAGVTTATETTENHERRAAEHQARIEEILKRRRPASK